MGTRTKTLSALAVAAVLGGTALAGTTCAGRPDGGLDGCHNAQALVERG